MPNKKSVTTILEEEQEKPLPFSESIENQIIGTIFLNNNALEIASDILLPEDFYIGINKHIFTAMLQLFGQTGINSISVDAQMKKNGNAFPGGLGVVSMQRLLTGLVYIGDEEFISLCGLVKEYSLIRQLVVQIVDIKTTALSQDKPITEVLEQAEQRIYALSNISTNSDSLMPVNQLVDTRLATISQLGQTEHTITGLETGFIELDVMTSGLQDTDLIIVAARPSMGKTALALTLALNASIYNDINTVIFSLEMSKEQVIDRLICSDAKVNSSKYKANYLSIDEWQKINESADKIRHSKLDIDDEPGIDPIYIRKRCRRISRDKGKIGLIVVDYLQLMNSSKRSESRQQEVSQISRELKGLAKELNCPLIALSQLSRAPEARRPPKPLMSDLRESGAIEQDADVVAFIYRDEYYYPSPDNHGKAEILISKNRNGPTGVVDLTWLAEFTRFENYTTEF